MSEDSDLKTIRAIQPGELRRLLRSGGESPSWMSAKVTGYASGHISLAAPRPDSEAGLRVRGRSCPAWRRQLCSSMTTRTGPAASVARRLADTGYTDVAVLVGGVAGWGSWRLRAHHGS